MIIQSDNSVNFVVIKMIMMTCAQAEYSQMNFAVMRTDRAGSSVGPGEEGGEGAATH